MFNGFVGGLNTQDSPYTLEPTESRDCLNVAATTRGSIRKRNGSTLFTASPPAVELTSVFPTTIGGTKRLIAFGGTKVYSINTSGTVTDITTEGADAHIDALAKKYLGVAAYPGRREDEVRIKVRVRPDHIAMQG